MPGEDFLLQAIQNMRDDLHAMEDRLNRRLDEIKPQCMLHAERITELEKWRAHQSGSVSIISAMVAAGVTVVAAFIAKMWR